MFARLGFQKWQKLWRCNIFRLQTPVHIPTSVRGETFISRTSDKSHHDSVDIKMTEELGPSEKTGEVKRSKFVPKKQRKLPCF